MNLSSVKPIDPLIGVLRRVFSNIHSIKAKKDLYISIVRSNLLYCSPLWRPYQIKDIPNL